MIKRALKFGFIGFGNHALRLHEIVSSNYKNAEFKLYNHREGYDKALPGMQNVYLLNDLSDCDAIFVSSPNDSHFAYLKDLIENYSGYVFCEKPPVTECSDMAYLDRVSDDVKKRFYFNFNYRFSPYLESLKNDSSNYALGRLISASIIQGHGLALKECYTNNWRSRKETHKQGVFETFSIHYFDMFVYLLGFPKNHINYTASLSPCGDSIDNSSFMAQFNNGATLNLTTSYTTPKTNSLTFVYENGIVVFDEEKKVYGPRDTFDERGLFADPPLIIKESFAQDIYNDSLKKSVLYFCEVVENKAEFDIKAFDASLNTNKLLFCT